MRVLITGIAGFIGSHLADLLLSQGVEVLGIDDLSNGLLENVPTGSTFVKGCITDRTAVGDLVESADVIVHLAARGSVPRSIESPDETFLSNVEGTRVIVDAARRSTCPVIFASSSSVYGANTEIPKQETSWLSPMSPYGASKAAGEALVAGYARSYSFDFQVFRFFNVYGPRQRHDHPYAAVIPKFIHGLRCDEQLRIYGDGEQVRDFTYVEDVCSTLAAVATSRRYGNDVLNLAFGRPRTVNSVLETLREMIFSTSAVDYVAPRTGEIRDSYAAPDLFIDRFRDIAPTLWDNGLASTLAAYDEAAACTKPE